MRKLNAKQKKLLDEWFDDVRDMESSHYLLTIKFDLSQCDEFTFDLMEELEKINDFETLNSAINNYISDKVSAEMK